MSLKIKFLNCKLETDIEISFCKIYLLYNTLEIKDFNIFSINLISKTMILSSSKQNKQKKDSQNKSNLYGIIQILAINHYISRLKKALEDLKIFLDEYCWLDETNFLMLFWVWKCDESGTISYWAWMSQSGDDSKQIRGC